jgi:hypothetical protein
MISRPSALVVGRILGTLALSHQLLFETQLEQPLNIPKFAWNPDKVGSQTLCTGDSQADNSEE